MTEFQFFQKSKQKSLSSLLDWQNREHTNGQVKISYAKGLSHRKYIIKLSDYFFFQNVKHHLLHTSFSLLSALSFHISSQLKTAKGTLP